MHATAPSPRGAERPVPLGGRARLLARSPALLPVAAMLTAIAIPAATLAVAGSTLGYDFRAYYAAAARVLAGGSAYDLSFIYAGQYGLFLYPPTFLPLILPFALLDVTTATWLWTAVIAAATLIGIARMPVGVRTRWLILLLAAQSWPLLLELKLGQVSGLLLLLFVEGWRSVARGPGRHRAQRVAAAAALGFSGAVGAAIKLQPGLILAWALLTRRLSALIAGAATLVILALLATLVAGPAVWADFLTVIIRASDPIGTPHNFTPGAVAYGLGLTRDAATAIQTVSMALVLLVAGWSALRLPAVASYLVVVVATQLLSPLLWEHYAVMLLVPVAWLLDRGWRAAALVPLATSILTLGFVPPIAYPMAFAITLVLLVMEGRRESASVLGRY